MKGSLSDRRCDIDEIRELRDIADPAERGRRVTQLLIKYEADLSELRRIRREVIERLRAQGMTFAQIGQLFGVSGQRISQLRKLGPPPERVLLGTGPLTIAVALKQEAEFGRPAVAQETVAAASRLKELARSLDLDAELEYVPPPGLLDLNRDNLVVLIGPRLSPLVAQVLESDPVLKFRKDEQGWYIVESRPGEEPIVHRSPVESGQNGCIGYLGLLPRPDQQGLFLFSCGLHAVGLHGAVHYLERELGNLYAETKARRFSMLVSCRFDPETRDIEASEALTPVYRHDER